jgi:hypothetical protein
MLDDIHEMHRSMPSNVSTRAMSNASGSQRKRARLGKSPVSAPSKTAYQQHEYHLNKAFLDDFKSVRHDECSDGAALMVVDIAESVQKWIWVRREEVGFIVPNRACTATYLNGQHIMHINATPTPRKRHISTAQQRHPNRRSHQRSLTPTRHQPMNGPNS